MAHPVVWVADVGSVKQGHFAWCRATHGKAHRTERDILQFAAGIAEDLAEGSKVALGFECPLFVPVTDDPEVLTRGREGDEGRPWSAGPGPAALACGLTECVWVFEKIHQLLLGRGVSVQATFDWQQFVIGDANLFVWEAFVTGAAKGESDLNDAEIAAATFWSKYPDIIKANAVRADNPFSLVAAALLRSGLTKDLSMLRQPCIVIRS
jgi:hypothetical protein